MNHHILQTIVGMHVKMVYRLVKHLQLTQKEFKFHKVDSGISEQTKPLQLVSHSAEFKFE